MTTNSTASMMMPTHMEILAMARELLLDRYQEEKDKILTRWQMMNNLNWNTTGGLLAYPEMPEYPTCDEILALARHLQEYFSEMAEPMVEYTEVMDTTMEDNWAKPEPTPEPFPAPATLGTNDATGQQPTQPSRL